MNKQRRKQLEKAFDLVNQAQDILQDVKEEEEEALENLPDSIRNSDRGIEMEGFAEMLEDAFNALDDANSIIEQI